MHNFCQLSVREKSHILIFIAQPYGITLNPFGVNELPAHQGIARRRETTLAISYCLFPFSLFSLCCYHYGVIRQVVKTAYALGVIVLWPIIQGFGGVLSSWSTNPLTNVSNHMIIVMWLLLLFFPFSFFRRPTSAKCEGWGNLTPDCAGHSSAMACVNPLCRFPAFITFPPLFLHIILSLCRSRICEERERELKILHLRSIRRRKTFANHSIFNPDSGDLWRVLVTSQFSCYLANLVSCPLQV